MATYRNTSLPDDDDETGRMLWTQFTDTGEKKMAARLEGNIVKYVGGVA
jgi:hypothetical protein